jgi:pyruvate/2-oxoglutarate dehydrogenase complex dihydrolipoamide dehydrogenase (E3) component
MSQPERFEVLVLGSGQGGKQLAWHMAQSGQRTAVVERQWIGGSCPNIACLPSKNEIWSAKVAHLVHHAAQFGMNTGPVAIDMAKVRQRKRDMVDGQIAFHLQSYRASGAELVMGSGRFVAPKTLEVHLNDGGTRVLAGDRVFVNVGTHAAIPDVPGLEAARTLTHIEALELDYLPAHLVVVGGGYSGLEFAQAYRRFGSKVTIIERLEMSAPEVWAIGECAGSPQFSHVPVDDFQIIRNNLAGGSRNTRDRLVPYCVFTDPPLAHVGLSEREAQRQGVAARVARLPTSEVLRAQATGEKQGLMNTLIGEADDRILGFTMIGADAGEVTAVVQTAILADMPYWRLRDAILTHPTMAEGLGSLFSHVRPRSAQRVTPERALSTT